VQVPLISCYGFAVTDVSQVHRDLKAKDSDAKNEISDFTDAPLAVKQGQFWPGGCQNRSGRSNPAGLPAGFGF
jgi:hypothetical protein